MKNKIKKTLLDSRYTIRDHGFTLIEFLIVLSIIVFIVPSVFGLIYSLLRQQSRIVALQEVKRQGDLVLNHMKIAIKNSAVSTYSGTLESPVAICSTAPDSSSNLDSMYFQNVTGLDSYFGYSLANGTKLQYEQTSSAEADLTNASVEVSNLTLGCSKSTEFTPPLVSVSYTVTQPANNVSLNYKTLIKLNTH